MERTSDPRVTVHPEAEEELRESILWYAERDERVASEFRRRVEAAIELIAEAPHRFPPFMHRTQRYVLRKFPFMIVYRRVADEIQVIAVAHAKRKPGYWKDRI